MDNAKISKPNGPSRHFTLFALMQRAVEPLDARDGTNRMDKTLSEQDIEQLQTRALASFNKPSPFDV